MTPPLTTTLDELREALKTVPTIKALTGRLGTFNDAWWDRFAAEVAAAQPAPPTEALRLLRELTEAAEPMVPAASMGPHEWHRYYTARVQARAYLDSEKVGP